MKTNLDQVRALLAEFTPDANANLPEPVQKALFVARRLQERASELQTPSERRQQAELDRMLHVPSDKVTLAQMTDQAFRANDPHRAVDHLVHILDVQGIPRFFNPWDRTLLKGFQSFGGYAPGVALPLVKDQMQKETANVILPGEKPMLTRHLHERTREGVRMNVNCLGEAILGEEDAERRLQEYLQALQWSEVEVVSIKISTLYSQISALAREHTVATLCDRLERLFRTAARMTFTRADGAQVPKFVYLDMEEYRDKDLTAAAFMRTLDRPGMEQVRAGIALQSYIPDTFRTLLKLQDWARQRVARGGSRITIRLVKGANMEMERVEASLRGWPQAPYKTKRETDANFRRIVHEVMKPENLAAMDVGIASHNLFELAYSLVLAAERDAFDRVQFEMLEGMANHQRRALFELSNNVLLYAPACKKENFINAIGYLIRRLDENTGPDNFLRHAFKIKVGSPEWERLEKGFLDAFEALPTLSDAPRRTQNQLLPPPEISPAINRGWQNFVNEPDTDFALPQNGEWAEQILAKWKPLCGDRAPRIPLVVDGESIFPGSAGDPPVPPGDPPGGTSGAQPTFQGPSSNKHTHNGSAGLAARAPQADSAPGARYYRRNLPHFEKPWEIYAIAFSTIRPRQLTPADRDIVLDCVVHWRDRRYELFAACVMPDHVHLLIQPGIKERDREGNAIFFPLSEILHSIKSYSAKEINKLHKAAGTLWQEESFDRYVRSDRDLEEKFHYLTRNPWDSGLVQPDAPYPWLWTPEIEAVQPWSPLASRKNAIAGSTGDSPVPPGDPPGGTPGAQPTSQGTSFDKPTHQGSAGPVARRDGLVARAPRTDVPPRLMRDCLDPSRPGVVVGRYFQATEADINRAVECAAADPDGWRRFSAQERFDILGRVAQELRKARGDLMGAALANGGKTLPESDPEVSEAVDFLEFYRDTARWWQEMATLQARPKGVVVVVPPWNFPIAIPCGGVAAALAAGNTVIIKPSSDAVVVAWELCQCFWRAGVSKKVLQFLPCSGGKEGRKLVNHPKVNAVILTGGTATALTMLGDNPRLNLFAETGGKDATIVTALSDRDQAIKHILHSAFSHSGQKCSATSLLLLEAEVYDDASFRKTLCDAIGSMQIGSAWDLDTKMGPLIRPPSGDLETALKVLEPGEEWAVMPTQIEGNPNLWSPGVKYGVQPWSYTHLTEFFGPVLGVMRFQSLREAVSLVNQTGYGLTSGLESLDEREWDYWLEHLSAGNLYLNRVTTGAVVLRQPFGGFGKSAFGPGMKAGGPNYVAQFMDFTDQKDVRSAAAVETPDLREFCDRLRATAGNSSLRAAEVERIVGAVASYDQSDRVEFSKQHDHFNLLGQDNFRRYLPLRAVRIRVHPQDTPFELFARVCAAFTVHARITVSSPPDFASPALQHLESLTEPWAGGIEFVEESDAELAQTIRNGQADRVRYAAPERASTEVLRASADAGLCVVSTPVSGEGRLELLCYVREQSISIDYHRYGNLGLRVNEARTEPL